MIVRRFARASRRVHVRWSRRCADHAIAIASGGWPSWRARQQRLVWLQAAGLSYVEMAAYTGDSVRTVERQVLRAAERVRQLRDERVEPDRRTVAVSIVRSKHSAGSPPPDAKSPRHHTFSIPARWMSAQTA
jgi:DNA-binding CsgD family transcriptional regulator